MSPRFGRAAMLLAGAMAMLSGQTPQAAPGATFGGTQVDALRRDRTTALPPAAPGSISTAIKRARLAADDLGSGQGSPPWINKHGYLLRSLRRPVQRSSRSRPGRGRNNT